MMITSGRILLFASLIFFASCGGGGGDRIGRAWSLFSAGQFSSAHANFVGPAMNGDPEAMVGLGWVCIELDSMPQAERYFSLVAGDSLPDGYAGWAVTQWSTGNYAGCISKAAFVLRHSPDYEFEFKPSTDVNDMIWYQAESFLRLGNFSASLTRIQMLDNAFSANLSAPDIADILAAKLELLAGLLI